MAQRSSLSGRSRFCQLSVVKKTSKMIVGFNKLCNVIEQQKLEETRDKPRKRKKTASHLKQQQGENLLEPSDVGVIKTTHQEI